MDKPNNAELACVNGKYIFKIPLVDFKYSGYFLIKSDLYEGYFNYLRSLICNILVNSRLKPWDSTKYKTSLFSFYTNFALFCVLCMFMDES